MSTQRKSRSPWWPTIVASLFMFIVLFALSALLAVMFGFGHVLQ